MSKITDASSTQIILAEETQYGVMPKPISGVEFGINGEGMAPNISSVESEELNLNPDTIDTILSGVDAGGDLNYEVPEGDGMKKILEHAVRGKFVLVGSPAINTLKSGALNKSMTIIKKFSSENGDFPFAYTGARLNTLSFDITADGGIITSTANFMMRGEKFLGNFAFYQKALAPAYPNAVGNTGDLLVTNSGNAFIKNDVAWKQLLNPFTGAVLNLNIAVTEEVKMFTAIPTTATADGILGVYRNNGQWYLSGTVGGITKYLAIEDMITFPDNEGIWRTGTANQLPADSLGVYGDYFVVSGIKGTDANAGMIFQKMSRESNAPWVQVANVSGLGFTPSSLYYFNMTVVPKSYKTKMHIPQFKNVAIVGVGQTTGTKVCFTDLGFTIENNCENVKGLCTERVEADFPWLSAVETKYGSRKISGNASILFNSVELYEDYFKKNKAMSLTFTMENGEGCGWKFVFPKIKFSEGSINAGAKGENIVIPLKWTAHYDPTTECAMYVEEIFGTKVSPLPLPSPVLYGASEINNDGFRLDYSYVETALGYTAEIATDSLFEDIVAIQDVPDATTLNALISGLEDNTPYFVRIKSYNSEEESAYSDVLEVVTIIDAPYINPTSPISVAQDDGSGNGGFVSFCDDVEDAVEYRLDVSTNAGFTSFVSGYEDKSCPTSGGDVSNLTGDITYYWRFRAVSAYPNNISANSNVRSIFVPIQLD